MKWEKKSINNPGALKTLKTIGHHAIPATTGAVEGLAGTAIGGTMGGIAGNGRGVRRMRMIR